jgi:two-component system sensor histidine kinase KdpD
MEPQARPDPDRLLARLKTEAEEQGRQRGRLKIFLGYAAGVGKTYAMLEAAHQRRDEGVDVVVGYVETHGRAETEARLAGLETVPRRVIGYRGVALEEMDLRAVLDRRPQLVLVDELAHTNAPGSLHEKRSQDVLDILQAGISVYTTMNVQHLESLNDVVAQITGITVRETVPDRVIDAADEIELVDLPPDELMQRLNEGKVYVPEQAARAIRLFFRKGNLTALRELTLRRAAERVDNQMRLYMQTRAIPGPWPAAERLLVCIGPTPLAERLVRSARRLADELNAEWLAVHVETPNEAGMREAMRDRVAQSMRLADQLGAKTMVVSGNSVAETILDYAQQNNVTKIIAGKPLRPYWLDLLRGSIVDQLIRKSGLVDVYVVSGSAPQPSPQPRPEPIRSRKHWAGYGWTVGLIALATILGRFFYLRIAPTNLVMIYLLVVVISALNFGRGPAVLASILGVLAFDFFLIPPYITFAVSDTQYILTFIALFAVGLVISQLAARAREQADAAQRRQAETAILYNLSRSLAEAGGLDEILKVVIENTSQTFKRDALIFLPEPGQAQRLRQFGSPAGSPLDENEMAVAIWSFEHGEPAGRGTETISASDARYLPLKTANGVVGVLCVKPLEAGQRLPPEHLRLLEAFASQAAVAIERARLAEQAQQADLLKATEKLQAALLNSISHDLRTPLVSITGVLTNLEEDGQVMDEDMFRRLVTNARHDADRLNRLVANLLDMSRLEAGALRLKDEANDVQDIIGVALEQLSSRLGDRQVVVAVEAGLPLAQVDFVLIVHVLVNLIDNALKYSSPDAPVEVDARRRDGWVQIVVRDRGVGIPPGDLERVFEKFYRVSNPANVSGTGLGLSISKGIVEAHGGRIWAENRPSGGAAITLSLPLHAAAAAVSGPAERGESAAVSGRP